MAAAMRNVMAVRGANVIVLSLLLLTPNATGTRSAAGFILSRGKAGPVNTGMTIDELLGSVGRNNTKLVDEQSEGMFSPAIEVYLGQAQRTKASLVAEIVPQGAAFVVGQITVFDPRFRTVKGIGVGSTLGEIRRNYRVNWIGFGEGPLFARVDQIGMSFALDYAKPPAKWYKTHDQNLIPDRAKVEWILLASK
jgi:hypothetical protein